MPGSFRFNTPNKFNLLPGQENVFPDSEAFCSAPEFVAILERYSKTCELPVIENCQVCSVEQMPGSKGFSATTFSLTGNNVTSIIWTTGFTADLNYLKLPVFGDPGILNHNGGISHLDGLYFLGLPWLRKRKSGIIMGIKEDAEFITERILAYAGASV